MDIVNTSSEKSFDPTPRLKSSPIPIKFIPFNLDDTNCIYCGEKYIKTLLSSSKKYCKKCLSHYVIDITDNNIYLDVHYTMDLECNEHEISRTKIPQSIQECCGNCVRILCFKPIDKLEFNEKNFNLYNKVIESERNCKLCGKSFHQGTDEKNMKQFKLCSDCYLISSGLMESTLVKKQISILYLPWWYDEFSCDSCYSKLIFTSDYQKYCEICCIFYVGCRYCLTTNIYFGPIDQSQCKKCKRMKRISLISEYSDGLDDFLFNNVIYDRLSKFTSFKFENIIKNIDKNFEPRKILDSVFNKNPDILEKKFVRSIRWIPYFQFKGIKEMTKGGYGIIYKATWLNKDDVLNSYKNETVILKRFENSKHIGKYFLNELKSLQHCFENYNNYNGYIIETYGFTKVPELGDYILVMRYASGGDLHKHLQKNFTNITWIQKIDILNQVSNGLNTIHDKKFMHRDFHSGNILYDCSRDRWNKYRQKWKIGDLGLSQAVNNISSNNEIYGVIPYIAPEIFKGSKFSQKSDIYGFGMIMWELTTGCKPFANDEHDIHLIYKILDGERPKITDDTPECYATLMMSCWDPDPKKRPSVKSIHKTFKIFDSWVYIADFNQAEAKRKKLIESKKLGPEFAEKRHSEAIYTSRPLSALISKCSSVYSSSTISFGSNYISKLDTGR
ncbi:kinase-like protein [Rhizophagus irregularis]|uniref:Kinase-like protein n=1 Tax=Rhizophagus irregularis TaxID=588596 RepID=A0A2N0RQ57_9GLOM|nr:kinase-like protein [Rhizophagus irregularis]